VLARDPAASEAAHRTPPGSSALRESEASAANVSDSNKAPSRNGNQPHAIFISHIFIITKLKKPITAK